MSLNTRRNYQNLNKFSREYDARRTDVVEAWNLVENNIDIVQDGVNFIDNIVLRDQTTGVPALDDLIKFIASEDIYQDSKGFLQEVQGNMQEVKQIGVRADNIIQDGVQNLQVVNQGLGTGLESLKDIINTINPEVQPNPQEMPPVISNPVPNPQGPIIPPLVQNPGSQGTSNWFSRLIGVDFPTSEGTPSILQQTLLPLTYNPTKPWDQQRVAPNKQIFGGVFKTGSRIADWIL